MEATTLSAPDERPSLDEAQLTLPYPEPGGETFTAGWSGSETSHERALGEASDGTMRKRLQEVYGNVYAMGPHGLTVSELRTITGLHHGQASSALSVLHMQGVLARLKERRDRCEVYVARDMVNGREESPHRRNKPKVLSLRPGEELETVSDDGTVTRWRVGSSGWVLRVDG